MISHRWKKLLVTPSLLGHDAFADWFRWGDDEDSSIPLVVFVGGEIRVAEYAARRRTRPASVVGEFEKALAERPLMAVDLLVIPCPIAYGNARDRNPDDFRQHLLHELLPGCATKRPVRIANVGVGSGARYAARIQFGVEASRALATIGGIAMAEALGEERRTDLSDLRFVAYSNPADPSAGETREFSLALAAAGGRLEIIERPIGSDLSGIAAEGSLADAFRFVLEALGPTPLGLE